MFSFAGWVLLRLVWLLCSFGVRSRGFGVGFATLCYFVGFLADGLGGLHCGFCCGDLSFSMGAGFGVATCCFLVCVTARFCIGGSYSGVG